MPKLTEATLAVLDAQIQTGAFCEPALLNELLRGYRAQVREARDPSEEDMAAIGRVICCHDKCRFTPACTAEHFDPGDIEVAREVIRAWRGRE